jgi:transcriptional regulator with XRE-family HTH domain
MQPNSIYDRIIFGLKVKLLRQKNGMSFSELSRLSGISISYLNEIEKGKKFPKKEKLRMLANALNTSEYQLESSEMEDQLAPVAQLLKSNFLNELPLDLYGIELSKVVEIIANAPVRVGAFISTLIELSQNHEVKEENFFFVALKNYLELNHNYFEDLEETTSNFIKAHHIADNYPVSSATLGTILSTEYDYQIVRGGLDEIPILGEFRALFLPLERKFLTRSSLTERQLAFEFGKELGFSVLKLKERSNTSSIIRPQTFEQVLNHSKAIYFSVALHLPINSFVKNVQRWLDAPKWNGQLFWEIFKQYDVSPEMFFHRLTNVLPRFFGMDKIFFIRLVGDANTDYFQIDRELHINVKPQLHSSGPNEHYCRKWLGISCLGQVEKVSEVTVQRSKSIVSKEEYLVISMGSKHRTDKDKKVSVSIGIRIDENLGNKITWLSDSCLMEPVLVNNSCERCGAVDCEKRVAPPLIEQRKRKLHSILDTLKNLNAV